MTQYANFTKQELLDKCHELGLEKYKSKNKQGLIELLLLKVSNNPNNPNNNDIHKNTEIHENHIQHVATVNEKSTTPTPPPPILQTPTPSQSPPSIPTTMTLNKKQPYPKIIRIIKNTNEYNDFSLQILHRKKYKYVLHQLKRHTCWLVWDANMQVVLAEFTELFAPYKEWKCWKEHKTQYANVLKEMHDMWL